MPLIPVDQIDPPTLALRGALRIDIADPLYASIESMGVLTPLVVVMDGNRFRVVDGGKRLAVAQMLRLAEVPVHIEPNLPGANEIAATVATNLVRAGMTATQQWRALKALQETEGFNINRAAAALGMDIRHAGRLAKLGALAPELLAALEAEEAQEDYEPPHESYIGRIAAAPHEAQVAGYNAVMARAGWADWEMIGQMCRVKWIGRGNAIFDWETAGVLFEEDLFAEPGSPGQWVTYDVTGFLAAQRAALAEQVAKRKDKRWSIAEWAGGNDRLEIPAGFQRDATQWHAPTLGKSDFRRVLAGICTELHNPGQITYVICSPISQPASAADATAAGDDDDEAAHAAPPPPPPPAEKAAITTAGRDLIAEAKTAALRDALRAPIEGDPPWQHLCAMLLLAFHASNVDIRGYRPASINSGADNDVTRRLIGPLGTITLPEEADLVAIIGETLARVLSIDLPSKLGSSYAVGSGPVAEWIGDAIGAARKLPRFDTPEILATINGDALRAAAKDAGMQPPSTVGELRKRLAGHLPAWLPPGAGFGAPAPARTITQTHDEEESA